MQKFSFTNHLISATLLQGNLFVRHTTQFPDAALETTVEAYPILDKAKLRTESEPQVEGLQWCTDSVLIINWEQPTFKASLLRLTTSHDHNQIREVLLYFEGNQDFPEEQHDTGSPEYSMLPMKKKLVRNISDFNKRVTESFATQEAKFLYE